MKASELIAKLIAAMAISGDDPYLDMRDGTGFSREITSVEVLPATDDYVASVLIETTGPEDIPDSWGWGR